jgi:phosphohistidine phosphatase SixA
MRIVLLRHATRKTIPDRFREQFLEKGLPLDGDGESEAQFQGAELSTRGIKPAVYFTSCFAHAKQTGEILRDQVGQAPIIELCSLTPHYQGPREWIGKWEGSLMTRTILLEAEARVDNLRDLDAIVLILHKPRLEQLISAMSNGWKPNPQEGDLSYSEGLCLVGQSIEAFVEGNAQQDGPLFRKAKPL